MKHTEKKAEKVERERAEKEMVEMEEKEKREERAEVKAREEKEEKAPLVDLMTLSSIRDLIASRDDNSRARIHAKAHEIRSIALSDEEGRLALYLVHAEGSV